MILTGERMILDRMRKETEIEHLCRYQYAKQFVTGKKVLDAACGSGYGTKILAEGAAEVVGMDISAEAIAYAENKYKQSNTRYLIGSVERLPFGDQTFDVVVSFETIEHVNESIQNSFLSEISRVLRKDGILIMSTPNKKIFTDERGGGYSEYHVKEFYVDEFKNFLDNKFDYVTFKQQFYAKSACIIGEEDCQAQIAGFGDGGVYVIAIASNIDIKEIVKESFVLRYPEEYEQMNDFTQVFYSNTMNFTEENSQISEIDNRNVSQIICIFFDGIKCKYLRIDPITGRGIICFVKIEITLADRKKIKVEKYTSNASKEENGTLYFYAEDAQIIIDLGEEKAIDSIDIEFLLVNRVNGLNGDNAIIQILMGDNEQLRKENDELNLNFKTDIQLKEQQIEERNKHITQQQKQIEELSDTINKSMTVLQEKIEADMQLKDKQIVEQQEQIVQQQEQLENIRDELLQTKNAYEHILQTKSWKYTQMFRKIGGFFRNRKSSYDA